MIGRILAILHARNIEFIRDKSSFGWNIMLPFLLVFGMAFIFSGDDRAQFKVGVLHAQDTATESAAYPFLDTRYIDFIDYADEQEALGKVMRHQLDLVIRLGTRPRYWINEESPKGYIVERLLLNSSDEGFEKQVVQGKPIRYVDWLLPGILGMNMMFGSLFGVGYVVVRYRKDGFLKRLQATPLRPFEFVLAQVLSRLILVLAITVFVYAGTSFFLDTMMQGSYINLFIVAALGTISLISMGLLVAARISSEEFAGGVLNMVTWPMMILSGVWFSLEGSPSWVLGIAKIFPLTHILSAARAIMLDGAGFAEIMPQMIFLGLITAVCLALGAVLFSWQSDG